MNENTQKTTHGERYNKTLKIFGIIIIIVSLLPSVQLSQLSPNGNFIWFWESISFADPTHLIMQLIGVAIIVSPFVLSQRLPARLLSVTMLLILVCIGFFTQLLLPHVLNEIQRSNASYFNAAPVVIFAPIVFYTVITSAVGSRLAIAFPDRYYPLIMMRLSSLLILVPLTVALFVKFGYTYGYEMLFSPRVWSAKPLAMIYILSFPAFFIITLLASFKKVSAKIVLPILYGIIWASIAIFGYAIIMISRHINFVHIYVFTKLLIVGFAYINIFNSSLYSCCYLFTESDTGKH